MSDSDRGLEITSADPAESIFGATTMKPGSRALTKAPCREAGLSQKEGIYGVELLLSVHRDEPAARPRNDPEVDAWALVRQGRLL